MYGKIHTYLLIAILIIGAICLYFLFKNNKDMDGQSSLLIAMAEKLNGTSSEEEDKEEKPKTKIKQSNKPTEEEEFQITAIADKLCFSKPLDQEELEFQKRFFEIISMFSGLTSSFQVAPRSIRRHRDSFGSSP